MKLEDWHRWWNQAGARELRRTLMEEWDPIGVRGYPEAAYEYDGYLGPLAARPREGASAEVVADYLTEIEEDRMGLGESAASRERNQAIAVRLIAWHAKATAE